MGLFWAIYRDCFFIFSKYLLGIIILFYLLSNVFVLVTMLFLILECQVFTICSKTENTLYSQSFRLLLVLSHLKIWVRGNLIQNELNFFVIKVKSRHLSFWAIGSISFSWYSKQCNWWWKTHLTVICMLDYVYVTCFSHLVYHKESLVFLCASYLFGKFLLKCTISLYGDFLECIRQWLFYLSYIRPHRGTTHDPHVLSHTHHYYFACSWVMRNGVLKKSKGSIVYPSSYLIDFSSDNWMMITIPVATGDGILYWSTTLLVLLYSFTYLFVGWPEWKQNKRKYHPRAQVGWTFSRRRCWQDSVWGRRFWMP